MPDNLLLSPDAQTNHAITLMRSLEFAARIGNDNVRVGPHTFLSIDPQGRLEGSFRTGGETVFALDYRVITTPGWVALHFATGVVNLNRCAVFGIVCRTRAARPVTIRACLRSAKGGGFVDAFFNKQIVALATPSTHVDLLRITDHADIPPQALWRELILFFPPTDTNIVMEDMCVFIV